jgi:transposase
MSTATLLYLFGIQNVECHSTEYADGKIIFYAESLQTNASCPNCEGNNTYFRGQKCRKLRMVPWGKMQCFLHLTLHRIACHDCGKCCWPKLDFVDGKQRMVRAFVEYVLCLVAISTILGVAKLLGVGWDLVKNIHKEHLKKKYEKIRFRELEFLSIDEFSIRKGHNYMTIFVDIRTGRIIHAVEGRSKADIAPFLRKLAKKAKNLKAIAMDMSGSFASAVASILPKVDIVFDHFHVDALINKALDEIRRQQQNSLEQSSKRVIKGKRFLLLKNYNTLDKSTQNGLQEVFDVNVPLFIGHSLKEQFRLFWDQPTVESASGFLVRWLWDVFESGLEPLIKVGRTLLTHAKGLTYYFKHKISNGKIEGINNKIKTMSRQAYGFRDMEYFKLRLLHLHEQKHSLTG